MASSADAASASTPAPVITYNLAAPNTKSYHAAILAAPLILANLVATKSTSRSPPKFDNDKAKPGPLLLDGAPIEPLNIVSSLATLYAPLGLSGADAAQSAQCQAFFSQAIEAVTQGKAFGFAPASAFADRLDDRLALRTFILGSGHTLTAADVALWAAVRASPPFYGILKQGQHVHLDRWAKHLDALPAFSTAIEKIREEQLAASGSAKLATAGAGADKAAASAQSANASFDLFLPSAEKGKVVTRFPPEPSGYLHVGHAKAAILNQFFARTYEGRLLIRFDDTNPSKEKVEFEDSIVEDLALLGIKGDGKSHTSDYFDELYRLAIEMIKRGKAYADDTAQEEMRAYRMDGIPSKRRDLSIEESLAHFAEMTKGSDEGARWCLRAKISVDDPNKALRDPVIYRVNRDTPHHLTGTKYKVYPTYDFACPIVDSLEGITHALRTNEYRDRNPQYYWMLEALGLRKVEIWDFARLNFAYTLLSKRKLQWFVDNGHVTGWDDPRFPTVRGIRRRGMTIECIQQFVLEQGPSQSVTNMEWDSIWALNKRIIDPIIPRYTAIDQAGIVKCKLNNAPATFKKAVPRHKKNPDLGEKTITFEADFYVEQNDALSFGDNEEITLMDWGNAIVRSKQVSSDGKTVTSLTLDANLDGDFKKTKKKVTWLSATPASSVPVALLDFDYLISKKKLEEDDKFEDHVTPQSTFRSEALADANISALQVGDRMQFERKGYFVLDRVLDAAQAGPRYEFIRIPDGTAKASLSKAAPEEDVETKKRIAAEARAAKKAAKDAKDAEKKAKKAAAGGDVKGAAGAALAAGGAAVVAGGAAVAAAAGSVASAVKSATGNAASPSATASAQMGDAYDGLKMYHIAQINSDTVETPAETKMYHIKPIV